jgi:hypothetical protein
VGWLLSFADTDDEDTGAMALNNFGLFASVWGKNAVITHIEFHEVRRGERNSWRALALTHDCQAFFSTIQGDPRSWASLDQAVRELRRVVPPLAKMTIVSLATQRYRVVSRE